LDTALGLLVLLGLAAWLWRDALRARERAIATCRSACRRHELQLLDETVAVSSIQPVWTGAGLRLRRTYEFEVSPDGVSRQAGSVTLTGARLDGIYLPGLWEGWEA
jgi:hypothetical protein